MLRWASVLAVIGIWVVIFSVPGLTAVAVGVAKIMFFPAAALLALFLLLGPFAGNK